MKGRWLLGGALLALAAFSACESSLSLDELLVGKSCRSEEPYCLDGYRCNERLICVLDDGQGGMDAGQGGSSSGSGGADENGGSGGLLGSGGSSTGGSAQGGAGGDAGAGGAGAQGGSDIPDAAPPGDGCVPGPLYRDRDGDGYGSDAPADIAFGCALPGYVSVGGDCHDESLGASDRPELVHPGQTAFLFDLFIDTDKPNSQSYDFNCDGVEEPDPSLPGPPTCPPELLGGLMCNDIGYAETGRTGTGINGLCGSETIAFCQVQGVAQCLPSFRSVNENEPPVGCR